MLSGNISIEDDDWDSVRQSHAALTRDLERIFLSIGQGGNDFGGGSPKSANDQTVQQDGNYGFNAVTTDMLDALEARFNAEIDAIPSVTYPISIANGGTGQVTQQTAINALAGGVTNARILRGNGTNVVLSQVDLSTDTTGKLPISNGGTGQSTQQLAINAIAGSTSNECALIGNGSNVVMSALRDYTPSMKSRTNFFTDGTFNVPAGKKYVIAILVGGGGGGYGTRGGITFGWVAASSGGATTTQAIYGSASSSGASGGMTVIIFDGTVLSGQVLDITIGIGGSGGAVNTAGGDGGDTYLVAVSGTYVAYGGNGGSSSISALGGEPAAIQAYGTSDGNISMLCMSGQNGVHVGPAVGAGTTPNPPQVYGGMSQVDGFYGRGGASGGSPSNPGNAGDNGIVVIFTD